MTKNEMRTSLKLINSYVKQEFPNIKEITIVNYEPLITETLSFLVETTEDTIFSERMFISKYLKKVFNTFGYGTDIEVYFKKHYKKEIKF
jgi:hypothetical protein